MDSEPRRTYPLYNTTFTLHRLSPLYTGSNVPLNNVALQQYAKSFQDILVGEVLRGVRVGLGSDEDVLARVGALQSVTWQLLPTEDIWDTEEDMGNETTVGILTSRGYLVRVIYEKASYTAILLRAGRHEDEDSIMDNDGDVFEHFPLLLTRMPGSLRETFTTFLSSTFDTRVSVLHLGKGYLTGALEQYILDCSVEEDGEAMDLGQMSRTIKTLIKDVQVIIAFNQPAGTSLKTIDFLISKEDLPRLVQSGKKIARREPGQSPCIAAVSNYVNTHIALDLRHENVKILKIACGAFVLGSEGKVKITEPGDGASVQGRASWNFINELVELGKGSVMVNGNG